MTMATNTNLKKTKKQLQQQQEQMYFKETVSDTHTKAVGIENQALDKSAPQKPPQENLSSPNESNVGPYDPFGCGEITDIISFKSQPQRTQKSCKPATTSSSKGSEVKTGSVSHEEDPNRSGENSVCMPHRPSLQSNQITSESCVPDISVSSTKTVIPKKSKRPSLNLQNLGEASPQHAEVPVTVRKGSSKTSSPKLPPSLAIKLPVHPPSSQLLSTAPTKLLSKGPSMIKKTSSSQEVCRNKVELVGFKTQEHPVVIILRGLPGSGKSYLARELMQEIIKANQRGVVLSTDDYFVQSGQYKFNRQSLHLAHAWNKQRALESMKIKMPFIIIDNTNTTLWELLPYAEMAIQHCYGVRVCEPDTPWKNKLQELSRKNEHGVPKENIKRMKERYETLTTERVIQEACKSLAARGKLTQLIQDGYEKVHQKAKSNGEEPKTPDLKTKTVKPQIHVENENTKYISTAPMVPEFRIMEWTSPKEQRKPVLRIKKGLIPKDPSVLCPTSPGALITLGYLNDSLKDVMVDRVEKESPSAKDKPEFVTRPSHTKTLTDSHDNEQLKEDEALARALQEEEDARIANSMSLGGDSIGSRPGEKTPHADHSSHGVGEEQPGSQGRLNSVSDTLHHMRGSTPKRLKPYKFLSRAPNAAPSSVWANQVKRNSSSDFHSIVEEEKGREAHDTRQMQVLRATGDSDSLDTKLKRQELSRKYPMVQADLLEEIFRSNLYSIETTERALAYQYEISPVAQTNDIHQTLMEDAFKRSHAENYRNGSSCRPQFQQWPDDGGVPSYDVLRREAQMYRNLGQGCQQKAQRHHRDMPSAAFFFRQEVKRYKSEEQNANQRAASVLFDRGSERLRRENTLDLHSFHLDEALKAVNTAIEMKREEFQLRPERRNTFLNIITGRGQNSKGGIPRLKPAVHAYLHDRHLKFEEKTSGMLKVYVFPRD